MNRVAIALLLLTLAYCVPGSAHYLDIAQFTFIQQEQPGRYQLLIDNLPQNLVPKQQVLLPQGCELLSRRESQPGYLPSVELEFSCAENPSGLIETQWGRDGGALEFRYLDGRVSTLMLTGSRSGTALTVPDWNSGETVSRSFIETAWLYLVLGTEHVLIGLDHLAFVFCLAMLASGRKLLYLITAFTVGHSMSLALSYLGIVQIPIAPVEAVIALSVVFMAREAILAQRANFANSPLIVRQYSQSSRVALTAGFGLVHGLGFASVLGDLGVSADDTIIALAFFNVGVEAGQVLFVSVVLLLSFLCQSIRVERPVIQTFLNLIGAMGLFWTLQRVIGV